MRLQNVTEARDEYLALDLAEAAAVFTRDVLRLQAGRQVLITSDDRSDMRVVHAVARAVAAGGGTALWLHHGATGVPPGRRPPPVVAAAAAAADVWIALSWNSFVYSEDWKAAIDGGTQYVSYEGLDVDGFVRCVGRVNAPKLEEMGEIVIRLLTDAEIHVTSAAGTDIAFDNRGGNVGAFRMIANADAIPVMLAGQVSWEPREASMTGTLVADGILSPPEEVGLIATPLRFAVEAGRITGIEGGREATLLEGWLGRLDDPEMTRIAHASIGFNPGVSVPTGRILEDERAFGDLDFGWGAWVGRPAAGHFDFTCRQVSMRANGVEILREGRYVHPELAALCAEMGVPGHAPPD